MPSLIPLPLLLCFFIEALWKQLGFAATGRQLSVSLGFDVRRLVGRAAYLAVAGAAR